MSDSSHIAGSVTKNLRKVRNGDGTTANDFLHQRYRRLVLALARRVLCPSAVADEEDVAINVWDSVFRRMRAGKFEKCRDRDDFEQLLTTITVRKALNLRAWLRAAKRNPSTTRPEEDILEEDSLEEKYLCVARLYLENLSSEEIAARLSIDQDVVEERLNYVLTWLEKRKNQPLPVLSHDALLRAAECDPGPLDCAIIREQLARLEDKYRDAPLLCLGGADVPKIAERLNVCERTIRRRFGYVRGLWEKELNDSGQQ